MGNCFLGRQLSLHNPKLISVVNGGYIRVSTILHSMKMIVNWQCSKIRGCEIAAI